MRHLSFTVAAVLLFANISTTLAATLQGTVVGIQDGDTITILDASRTTHKIRLSGIDAPEKKQPYGNASKQALSDMVYERTVTIEYDKYDRYGRKVGKVLVNGMDANLEQVRAGLAWHYKKYQKEQPAEDRLEYGRAEVKAREEGKGLWKDAQAVPPWDYRHIR
ncbi:MAG: thermonuclease family protein [Polaromonas sp.]|uniref:thermonuclease family protein n=1 Tax=Polaromonas sp. TaxID=1869339 RepID=UPI0025FCE230|nr:thermonuclease family protein [Polaromonas sp.]MBI2724926.1 thermonuclease family protein [Polaromonas sp.]